MAIYCTCLGGGLFYPGEVGLTLRPKARSAYEEVVAGVSLIMTRRLTGAAITGGGQRSKDPISMVLAAGHFSNGVLVLMGAGKRLSK